MTIAAGLICMCTDRPNVESLCLVMTAHAARRSDREIGSEAVTVLARRRLGNRDRITWMEWGEDLTVALPAQIRGWRSEAGLTVTVAAWHLCAIDVGLMPGA